MNTVHRIRQMYDEYRYRTGSEAGIGTGEARIGIDRAGSRYRIGGSTCFSLGIVARVGLLPHKFYPVFLVCIFSVYTYLVHAFSLLISVFTVYLIHSDLSYSLYTYSISDLLLSSSYRGI